MAKNETLRKALDDAIKDGNDAAARQIAQQIVVSEREPSPGTEPFSEAAARQAAIQGTVADRERMRAPDDPSRRQFGTLSDLAQGVPRGAFALASLPPTLAAAFPDSPTSLQAPRQQLAQQVQQFGQENLPPSSNTVLGTAGEFIGAGGIGGIPNIARATAQSGIRGLVGSTARNVGGSGAAAFGAEAGGNLAEDTGLPRIAGEIPGALLPSGIAATTGRLSGASQAQRAANSQVAREALDDAARVGLDDVLSAGIASPNSRVKTFERLLASVPGGMRVMHEFARNLNARLTGTLQGVTGQQSRRSAGISLSSGINRRINNLRTEGQRRYDIAERAIDPATPVQTTAFQGTLNRLIQETPDTVEDIVNVIRSGKGEIAPQLDEALNKLINIGNTQGVGVQRALTFREADAIRKAIGAEISGSSVVAPNPFIGELKALYAALSNDVTGSLSGQQKVLYNSARKNWDSTRRKIDQILDPVLGGKGNIKFDDIYKRAFSEGGENVSVLKEVYRGLNASEREVATKTLIARMGRVGDEALAEAGEIPLNPNFRMQSFITSWRKLPAESKDIIFRGQEKLKKDMDSFVRFVDRTLETNAAFANPSQSGPIGLAAATAYLTLAGAAGAGVGLAAGEEGAQDALTGAAIGVGGLLAAAKGTAWAARLMTSPRFVNWLARGTRVPVSRTPEHIARLSVIAQDNPEIAGDIASFMDQLAQNTDERQLFGPRREGE